MIIFTIGFTQKSAEQFFELIRKNQVQLLVDVRLNNKSQLAGFSKGTDLAYFLKEICGTKYIHCEEFAPTKELLTNYQKGTVSWNEYEEVFDTIMEKRGAYKKFLSRFKDYDRVCLLCSEPTAEKCHRRLVAEKIKAFSPDQVEVIHL
ncbi:MAG: DUF488 domain-containing protein [Oscillospiraceae bacterium]|nr:DUF488 domain-containing protein [Oscillospiraceae bacterium]